MVSSILNTLVPKKENPVLFFSFGKNRIKKYEAALIVKLKTCMM